MKLDKGNLCFLWEVAASNLFLSSHVQLRSPCHCDQVLRIDSGTASSQSTFCSHRRCSKTFTLMMDGENHPSASNVRAMSETRAHFGDTFKRREVANREPKVDVVCIPCYA